MTRTFALAIVVLACPLLAADRAEAAESPASPLAPVVATLAAIDDVQVQRDILRGLKAGLYGRRQAAMPPGWSEASRKLRASEDAEIRKLALELSLVFNDPEALAALRKTVDDATATVEARQAAIEALVRKSDKSLVSSLQTLLASAPLRGAALRGLAELPDDKTPGLVLAQYPKLTDAEKREAVLTLSSRPPYARELISALEAGKVPRQDLDAFTVRQLHALGDAELSKRLSAAWGVIRAPAETKAPQLARLKKLLTPERVSKGNLVAGRQVFQKNCAACHVLFDAGGKIGPELTGGQRTNLDYVLENLLDPSAVVGRDYQVTVFETTAGRVLTGIVTREDERAVTVQTPTEAVVLPKSEIENRQRSTLSLMPEGVIEKLKDDEVRDLVAYLAAPRQVPLPE